MQWQAFSAALRRFPASDRDRIEQAFRLGEKVHGEQKRRSGEPYFAHPVAVARILIDWWADADTVIAALLHDTVEDTPLMPADIERDFGRTVRALVEGVTKLTREELENHPTLDEQIETLRKMFSLMQEDVRIMVIKLADRLHNMQTIRFLAPEKQIALARETLEVYVRIAERLCMYDLEQELEALCTAILEPDLFARLSVFKKDSDDRAERIAADMRTALREDYAEEIRGIEIVPEQKSWRRLRQQLEHEGAVATGVSVITVVFVCPDIDACYRTLGFLHQLWKRETLSFQDFINSPQINGYRGLHTTIILSDGTRVRCKIRTQEMHRYAHQGITTLCFDPLRPAGTSKGFLDILPWAKRISPLAEDTKDRSREFWDSLQSDILGESIVLHGPGDETVMVPKDATALDGAFYFFRDLARRTDTIKVNGKEAPFRTVLKHGDTLDVSFAGQPTVHREWLEWTKTGLATASIRSALALSSPAESIASGKAMLQSVMHERQRGFLEEFDEKTLTERLQPMGYASLNEAYRAVAEGRATPTELFNVLFAKTQQRQRPQPVTIRYSAPMSNVEMMDALNNVHRAHGMQLNSIQYRRGPDQALGTVLLRGVFTRSELDAFTKEIHAAGGLGIQSRIGRITLQLPGIICMLTLWGLDPVLSKAILLQGVHPMSFTLIRAISIFLFSVLTLLWMQQERRLSRISITSPTLWLAGIAFFLVSLFTYLAVQHGSPVLYNTLLRSNAFLVSLPDLLGSGAMTAVIGSSIVTVGGLLLLRASDIPKDALLFGFLVLLSFSVYTIASNRFQSSARVLARLPQFFTVTSAIAALCAFVSFLVFPTPLPPPAMTGIIAVYSVVFIGIPYVLFYTLRRLIGYAAISPWNHLLLAVTFLGQWLVFGIDHFITIAAAAILLTAGSLIAARSVRLSGP